jgi:serine/threonine protein kinase
MLAELERRMENDVELSSLSVPNGIPCDAQTIENHRKFFELVHDLASPLRAALGATDIPPVLADYRELVEIGRGGMGIVYRAQHIKTLRTDAIKVIRPDRLASVASDRVNQLKYRFEQESRLAARVAHEYIVPVYQVGEIDGQVWFSMLYVDGPSLHEVSHGKSIAPEKAARIMECIARAVDVVHRSGILHGDIKPQNILIERETDRPLISDFGLAEFECISSERIGLSIAGTPSYMAPELALAALSGEDTDGAASRRSVSSDIYSLGATLWSVLAGCSPCHEGRTQQQQLTDVVLRNMRFESNQGDCIPMGLRRICRKCLEVEPSARYASAAEVANELTAWLNRPSWNRHFPGLRQLLVTVVAPVLAFSGLLVSYLLRSNAHESWIWLAMLWGYGPLFATFFASQRTNQATDPARRELWSVWVGHLCASLACLVACRIIFHDDTIRTISVFYPCWAAISSVTFFAKSGNFWIAYRWFGVAWSLAAIVLTIDPLLSPTIFGVFAAITCVVTALGDRAFDEH